MKHLWILLLAPAVAFAAPTVDFDQGVDVAPVLTPAEGEAPAVPEPDAEMVATSRTERDCQAVEVGSDVNESARVFLRSTRYERRCYPTGDPRGGQSCRDEFAGSTSWSGSVTFVGRSDMFPWEKDIVDVCLDGYWIDVYKINTTHKYDLQHDGGSDRIYLHAKQKIASWPDKHGLEIASWGAKDGGMGVVFSDKWTSYYAGEKVRIEYKVRRHREGWFDDTLHEGTAEFDAAQTYALDFKDKFKNGKEYYVEWSFQRLGAVSTDRKMKRGDGPKAVFGASLLGRL